MKYVIIVGGGALTVPMYEAAERLGYGTICFDQDTGCPGMEIASFGVPVSTKDIDLCVHEAEMIAEDLDIAGVVTCGADVEVTVAAIAEALDLPGIPVKVAKRCNDKLLMHRHLDMVGFTAKPGWCAVRGGRWLRGDSEISVGWPRVVKPLNNCASRGVQVISGPDQLLNAVTEAEKYGDTWIPCFAIVTLLYEEYLEGTKHTVEMVAHEGQDYCISIIDTNYFI